MAESKKKKKSENKKERPSKTAENIAVIRIRGMTGIRREIADTMRMLNLNSKFSCAVLPKNKNNEGMVKKAKDFITWGEIDAATLKELEEKRKEEEKKTYRLHPPRGGFERKGTKKSFSQGGALGYRKEKINDLIKRMM